MVIHGYPAAGIGPWRGVRWAGAGWGVKNVSEKGGRFLFVACKNIVEKGG